jgi:hypothetical protein
MKASAYKLLIVIMCVLFCLPATFAHRPIFTQDKAVDPNTAVVISTPDISQVIYRAIDPNQPQLWLAVDADEGFELYVQIGVPVIERLKNYRPAVAVVGPGLANPHVPFAIPDGSGAVMIATEEIETPRFFHEHFTGTDSWILHSQTIILPETGRYYIVAYDPAGKGGKLWLSVGRREQFSAEDWAQFAEWKRKIRRFHEVPESEAPSIWTPFGIILNSTVQVIFGNQPQL